MTEQAGGAELIQQYAITYKRIKQNSDSAIAWQRAEQQKN